MKDEPAKGPVPIVIVSPTRKAPDGNAAPAACKISTVPVVKLNVLAASKPMVV